MVTSVPRISIVTATYNRANVLRLTIESALASTFADWELIVVGDACTDDTEDVVRSFADPRLRFVNLPVNSGEQATPNNEGVRLARGELIAFHNHDDLWTRDHLATCLEAIDGGAELVSTVTIAIDEHDVPRLEGVCPRGTYEPHLAVRASSWLLRRSLMEAVGPWRPAREIFAAPSQNWLYRAWQHRARIVSIAKPTVVAVNSGRRAGSYANRDFDANAKWAASLRDDPHFIERVMTEIACRETYEYQYLSVTRHLVRAGKSMVRKLSRMAGVHPWALRNAILFRRRGGFLDSVRRIRGLPPLPRGETR
jgi:glycosyltransferase involved in cell wall biosynthesis